MTRLASVGVLNAQVAIRARPRTVPPRRENQPALRHCRRGAPRLARGAFAFLQEYIDRTEGPPTKKVEQTRQYEATFVFTTKDGQEVVRCAALAAPGAQLDHRPEPWLGVQRSQAPLDRGLLLGARRHGGSILSTSASGWLRYER